MVISLYVRDNIGKSCAYYTGDFMVFTVYLVLMW